MNQETSNWTLIIKPKTRWLNLQLGELWRYRDLTMIFVWRDFVATYKQTILGPLWYLVQPIFTTLVFTVIFGRVAGIPTDGLPPMVFYLCGISAWGYFAECLNRTSTTFVGNAHIFGKVYFPRLCAPVSLVISGLIRFAIQFGLFLVVAIYYRSQGAPIHPNQWALVAPFLLLIMAGLGLGSGIIVSALTTRYRDLQHLVAFGVQLLMYATPIIYPLSRVPVRYQWIVLANPMTSVIETFRYGFLGAGTITPLHLVYAAGVTGLVLLGGIVLFHHVERTFMDTV